MKITNGYLKRRGQKMPSYLF